MAPCRRNPKGTGGLRRHTASELLSDALASLSSSFLVWHSQPSGPDDGRFRQQFRETAEHCAGEHPCARPHPTSATPFYTMKGRPNPLVMALAPEKRSMAMTIQRTKPGFATRRILTPMNDPNMIPIREGTTIMEMTHPWLT